MITPDGRIAYALNRDLGTVTPIDIRTRVTGSAIRVGGMLCWS